MTDILAIDVATKTGFARGVVGSVPDFGTINFGKMPGDGNRIFGAALEWMHEMIEVKPPDIVILEAMLPPDAMKNKTSRQVRDRLAGLHGIIRAVAFRHKVGEVAEGTVGDVRAHFLGVRNLRRLDAKKAVIDRCQDLGWDVANDNEADALALWSYACGLIDPASALRVSPLFNPKLKVTVWP